MNTKVKTEHSPIDVVTTVQNHVGSGYTVSDLGQTSFWDSELDRHLIDWTFALRDAHTGKVVGYGVYDDSGMAQPFIDWS